MTINYNIATFSDKIRYLFKNPLSIWFMVTIKNIILCHKNKKKHLKIGYMSRVSSCSFGRYNTLYNNVLLNASTLNDFTYIADGTQISRTIIGKFCSIGPDCKIGLGKHPSRNFVSTHPIFFSTLKQTQITFADKDYFKEFENIEIGNDVWIGANVIVVDGVKIGDGAIVAAGSVVTGNVAPYAIVGGVPAKTIRYRFDKAQVEQLLEIEWWNFDDGDIKNKFQRFHSIEAFLKESYV